MVPKIEFEVSKVVNEFCHLSVLYSDLMPTELTEGILQNRAYQERYHNLRDDATRLKLQATRAFPSESEWYKYVAGLTRRDETGGFQSMSSNNGFTDLFRDLRERRATGFDQIWKETRPRLEEYMYKFKAQWTPISDHVLLRFRDLAKAHWQTDKIRVHFIDCLYGGFGWDDCIGFTAFPDMEVQKKFLAHELSEIITPHRIVAKELRKAALNPGITHTVVDMLAYFSVKDFLEKPIFPNPEKKGIRPNQKYYPEAEILFPVFERYAQDPWAYRDFTALIEEIVHGLQPQPVSSTVTPN